MSASLNTQRAEPAQFFPQAKRMLRRSGLRRCAKGGVQVVLLGALSAAFLAGAATGLLFAHEKSWASIMMSVAALAAVFTISAMKGRS